MLQNNNEVLISLEYLPSKINMVFIDPGLVLPVDAVNITSWSIGNVSEVHTYPLFGSMNPIH